MPAAPADPAPAAREPERNPFAEADAWGVDVHPLPHGARIALPTVRPFSVIVRRVGRRWIRPVDLHPDVLVIAVPTDMPVSRFLVMKAVAFEINVRLACGDSLEYALKVACGADWIV